MNPAPSLYSSVLKMHYGYFLKSKDWLKLRTKKGLNMRTFLNREEGAG